MVPLPPSITCSKCFFFGVAFFFLDACFIQASFLVKSNFPSLLHVLGTFFRWCGCTFSFISMVQLHLFTFPFQWCNCTFILITIGVHSSPKSGASPLKNLVHPPSNLVPPFQKSPYTPFPKSGHLSPQKVQHDQNSSSLNIALILSKYTLNLLFSLAKTSFGNLLIGLVLSFQKNHNPFGEFP